MAYNYRVLFLLFLIVITIGSCSTKVYPDEKLAIDPNFLTLFNSLRQKDTIQFISSNGRSKTFVITKVDSIISNKKGWFINEAPYKLLRFSFRETGKDTVRLERENEIFVNKAPAANINTISIQFSNFYFHDSIIPPLRHDTLNLNAGRFMNHYSFETSLRLKNPDDIKVLYINVQKGFLGFKTLSGEIWVNR